jgi:hypothetical protein
MLAQARVRAVEEGVELDLREGDIRELEIEEPAALIYCPGRSLLQLPTWADRRRCFERVAASLRSNGRFAWNAFAFDHHVASAIDGQHADTPLPHTNYYSVSDNRVDITLDDGGTGSLWWATKNEWLGLLDVAGLRLEALYGGFAGEPLDDDSREYIFVARRQALSLAVTTAPGDIPALTVILEVVVASGEWQRLGRRRLTRFPHVARELTCQRCVAAADPRPPSVT